MKTVEISKIENSCGKDELRCEFFRCPDCKNCNVLFNDNFCSNCGGKFKWIN